MFTAPGCWKGRFPEGGFIHPITRIAPCLHYKPKRQLIARGGTVPQFLRPLQVHNGTRRAAKNHAARAWFSGCYCIAAESRVKSLRKG